MNAMTNATQDLEIFRTGLSLKLDALAYEQVIVDDSNGGTLEPEDAANINSASFRNRGDRNFFKNQYTRHARNIAAGNRFYASSADNASFRDANRLTARP